MRRRGYALPMVMMILALLALGFSMLLFTMSASLAESKRVGGQLRAFYACDSAIRLASTVAQRVVTQFPTKTPDELTTLAFREICNTAGGCAGTLTGCPACEFTSPTPGVEVGPDGFMPPTANMEYFAVRVFPRVAGRSVQEGAFRDLNAQQSLVALSTQAIDLRTATVAKARETFTLASLSPFQLMAFATTPLSWRPLRSRPAPGSSLNIARIGPAVYAGGALNLGSGQPLNLVRAVSAVSLAWTSPVKMWDGSVGTPTFTSMSGVGPDGRRANLIARPLMMTAALSTAAPAQPAAEQALSARWLLDPPVLGEGAEPTGAKLATQADVRILDGVWFVKPPEGSSIPDWPGIPVWSDHAGTNVAPSTPEELKLMTTQPSGVVPAIGQGDIASAQGWPSRPRRYSYYEFNAAGAMVETLPGPSSAKEGVGVVSYGSLSFTSGRIVPGSYSSGGPLGFPAIQPPGPCANASVGFSRLVSYDQCLPSSPQNAGLGLLEAARGGFKDFSAQQAGLTGRVLPMNFDVEQFLIAMTDGTNGELGSYFCGAQADVNNPTDVPARPDGTGCRRFNGIVYIAATWPGSLNGVVSTGSPAVPPAQGQTTALPIGLLQPLPTFQNNRTYLPRQLCAGPALENSASPVGLEGGPGGASARFPAIGCNSSPTSNFNKVYGSTGPAASVTALRIFNGRDLSRIIDDITAPQRFGNADGLTIATNLPVYIFGDWNSISGAAAASGVTCPTTGALPAECFFPRTWVAGDRITFVSRIGGCVGGNPGYNDSCARWSDTLGFGNNTAAQSFYFGAFSSSLSPSVTQENVESLFRVIERWSSSGSGRGSLNVVGAMFGMGRAYYQREPQAVVPSYVPEPDLDWRYLSQLSAQDQPPGTPRFVVGVTSRWRDLR